MPDGSRRPWRWIASLVLALDGLGGLLLGLTSLMFANFGVAAVEGRTGNPNAGLGWYAVGFAAFGIACLVAAWRIGRGSRSTRYLGVGLTLLVAGLLAASVIIGPMSVEGRLTGGLIALAHVVVAIALLRWSPTADRSMSGETNTA